MYKQIYTERPFHFTKHSTIGCGGFAETAYYPKDEREVLSLLSAFRENWLAVGNLSNVLTADEGTKRTVICTKKMTEIRETDDGVFLSAGVTSGMLLRYMQETGCGGAEFFAGIPCTVGGMLYMNGGAGGKYIAEITKSVRILRDGKIIDLPVGMCEYSYKNSLFMCTDDFILGGIFRLEKSDKDKVKGEIRRHLQKRAHLPKGKSMGCVFKNPQDVSAGALIEQAGLKGVRVGGAKVSELHANFILNDQNASSADICTLIQEIKNAVYSKFGVALEEEIRYIKE